LKKIQWMMNGVYENMEDKMVDREKNLGVRVGDSIIHCNGEFTIVDIKREETSEGMKIWIVAIDPDMADREQQKQIAQDQIGERITELIKKLAEKGIGGLGDFGR
jgi:Na+-translocating ferredoxin:NAD+ oxidoreductase RnfC subunit